MFARPRGQARRMPPRRGLYRDTHPDRLGWMYDKVADRLAEALGAPTRYPDDLALPGFHVFVKPISSKAIHFDGQHRHLNWGKSSDVDLQHPLSFTLAIALPRSGSGLMLWDI